MGRALSLLLLLALLLPKALGQSVNCDATDLLYDFSAPGSLTQVTVAGQPYYVANQASYLLLLDGAGSMRFLPTAVTGGTGYRVACTVRTPNRNARGGTLCGAGRRFCLRVTGVSGSLPVDWTSRLYVMVQVVSGNATSLAPTPTLLSAVPDNRGLADIGRNTTATLHIYYWVELAPGDLFPTLPATGALTLTYQVQGD
ncbi:hypothetical protein [Thermus aquaticus]|uniref:Uncharacterized protein n=1 Tax=Thermus aquaticus (strain ATCC BAA-2747 / Y51MC23) TaxID=498848 RepID=A0ABM5VLT5_THEA5|nr:hypothetical protein [Thermus aquaticus]ALJ91104.1 hypothetical protein TO73_1260 [Thermus aquaticus Y51MC23]